MKNCLRSLLLVSLTVSSLLFLPASVPAQSRKLALVGGTLIDGYGSRPIYNSVIIIEGERIKAIGQVGSLAIPSGAEVISTEGMTVLPGLWDMHVHHRSARRRTATHRSAPERGCRD
jgi:imidazolonepropionase-like amidohydrolase